MDDLKERAEKIRGELKKQGYGRKEISVRIKRTSMCQEITIGIKSVYVDLETVKSITKKYEKLRKDNDGCLLKGGNVFVGIQFEL